jgi:hypothetical protein
MNTLFLVAAALMVFLAAAHSYLGERLILIPLFSRRMETSPPLMKQTLRLAWHITSVLAVGIAAILVVLARGGGAPIYAEIIAASCALSGIVSLVFSRGKHLSWIVFFAIAALTWFGAA